jgi:hypothetical protein
LVCLPDKAGSRTQLQCMSELISSNGNNAWWCQKTSHHGWERNDWKFVTTATVLFSRLSWHWLLRWHYSGLWHHYQIFTGTW